MKTILTIVLIFLICLNAISQELPQKGDYIMLTTHGSKTGSYVFKSTNQTFYHYNFTTKTTENTYIQDKKIISELFKNASKISWSTIKGMDENSFDINSKILFYIIEYKHGKQKYRICFKSGQFEELDNLMKQINGLW